MTSLDDVLRELNKLQAIGKHEFWPDDVSLLDSSIFYRMGLQRSRQVTDTYLLGLAAAHSGKVATLDRRLIASGVHNGDQALLLIEP